MNSGFRQGLHTLAIALATLWFWHRDEGEFMRFYVRPRDLGTNHEALINKKITIEIRIEEDK